MEALEAVWGLTLVFFGWCLWVMALVGALIIFLAFGVGISRTARNLLNRQKRREQLRAHIPNHPPRSRLKDY